MAQIKGFAIRGILKFVKESGHAGGIADILEALPAEVRPQFDSQIVASRWYPYETFCALVHAVEARLGPSHPKLLAELGRKSGESDHGTIFKIIATIASLQTIINRSQIFWAKYCDAGKMEAIEATDSTFRVALKDFPEIDPFQCEMIRGWTEGVGKATGVRRIDSTHSLCVHRGDPWCEYSRTYEK